MRGSRESSIYFSRTHFLPSQRRYYERLHAAGTAQNHSLSTDVGFKKQCSLQDAAKQKTKERQRRKLRFEKATASDGYYFVYFILFFFGFQKSCQKLFFLEFLKFSFFLY